MTEETTVTTGETGTSATVAGSGVSIITEGTPRDLKEMLLYKIDRTLAIAGLIVLGIWALKISTSESIQIAMAAVGVLGGYIGGRTGR